MKQGIAYICTPAGISLIDCLEIDGDVWLIPEWLDDHPSKGLSTPARAIRATLLGLSRFGDGWMVHRQIPKAVLEGTSKEGFDVLEGPSWNVVMVDRSKLH